MSQDAEKRFQNHIADYLIRRHGYAVLEQVEISYREYSFAENQLIT